MSVSAILERMASYCERHDGRYVKGWSLLCVFYVGVDVSVATVCVHAGRFSHAHTHTHTHTHTHSHTHTHLVDSRVFLCMRDHDWCRRSWQFHMKDLLQDLWKGEGRGGGRRGEGRGGEGRGGEGRRISRKRAEIE